MIVRNLKDKSKPSYGSLLNVYGIYWINSERMYFVIPYDGYEGFIVMRESETEIVDPYLRDTFVLRKNDANDDIFLHWGADQDDLIYRLLEHEPAAMSLFRRRLELNNPSYLKWIDALVKIKERFLNRAVDFDTFMKELKGIEKVVPKNVKVKMADFYHDIDSVEYLCRTEANKLVGYCLDELIDFIRINEKVKTEAD